jgi:hypothetical protein
MTNRNASPETVATTNHLTSSAAGGARKPTALLRSTLRAAAIVVALVATSMAAELPDAPSSSSRNDEAFIEAATPVLSRQIVRANPETKLIDKKFVALALISTASTFADSYTTLFARQNWLAGKKGVCNAEVQSAYLYGTHPTVGRAYAVASLKSVGAITAAYYLRKHHHSKLWSSPLLVNSISSLQGTTQNMIMCN